MAERIKHVRDLLKLSQEQFGKLAGVSKSAVSQWERAQTTPERDALFALQKNARVNPKWITDGIDPIFHAAMGSHVGEPLMIYGAPRDPSKPIVDWEHPGDLPTGQYVSVPRTRVRVSTENGLLVFEEERAPPLTFATVWIKRKGLHRSNLVVLEASDDRMEPRIYSGDMLLVNRGHAGAHDSKIYVLRYGHELRVQRLSRRYDGALILQSLNPSYRDETIPAEALDNQIEIVGCVVWASGGVS